MLLISELRRRDFSSRPVLCVVILWLCPAILQSDDVTREAQTPADHLNDEPRQLAIISDERIDEASGLARSIVHPDTYWMHNDSGDSARLFLVGLDGATRAVVRMPGITAFDWEDMCSFELDQTPWLLIADIGDNAVKRGPQAGVRHPVCRLLLVKELPLEFPADDQQPRTFTWRVHSSINFAYEDGPRDCESVAVDIQNRRVLLISKSLPMNCGMYELPLTLERGQHTATARRILSPAIMFATAMDISPQNDRMVVVTPWNGVLIERAQGEEWQTAVSRPARHLVLPPRRQGETVCFTADGNSLLLNSEGIRQPLWQVHVPRSLPKVDSADR